MQPVRGRELVLLAIPAAASVILNNAYRVIDQYVVQWLGKEAQAAIGSTTFVLILFYAAFLVVSAGVGPLVARARGAGDQAVLRRVLGNGLVAALVVGVAVWSLAAIGSETIVAMVGLKGRSGELMATYLFWLSLFGLPMAISPVVDAAFIAVGNTRLPMILHLVATVLNVVLSWFFIYEVGMGIAGAAVASGISRGLAVAVGLAVLWRTEAPSTHDLWLDSTVRRITRVGMPIGLNTALYAGVYWALLKVAISPLGPAVNAALGIGFSALEGVTWPIFHGISLAVASVVGRQLGADAPEEAVRAVRLGMPMALGAGLVSALVFWFGATPLCSLFTEDPEVLAQGVLYARILSFTQIFVAIEAMSEGVLAGAGDTRTVLWWSAPLNLLRVPLGWALAFPLGMGAAGIWWAINLTTVVKALGKGAAVLKGRWKHMVV